MARIENGGTRKKKSPPRLTPAQEERMRAAFVGRARTQPSVDPIMLRAQQLARSTRLPSEFEFSQMARELIRQNFPLTPVGEKLLRRTRFQFMPGEPGWAGASGEGWSGIGASAPISTFIHEWTHNLERPGALMAGISAPGGSPADRLNMLASYLASVNPPGRDIESWRMYAQQLRKQDPAHLYNIPLTTQTTPFPEAIRQRLYPFLSPGASPIGLQREGAGVTPAFPSLLYADIAANPQAYRGLANRDPNFFFDMARRAGLMETPMPVMTTRGTISRTRPKKRLAEKNAGGVR